MKNLAISVLVVLWSVLSACGDNGSTMPTLEFPEPEAGEVSSVRKVASYSPAELRAVFRNFTDRFQADYGVDVYEVIYRSRDAQDLGIWVSGQLVVPQKVNQALSPRLSYQHGTIFLNEDAPSKNFLASDYPVLAASLGFIVTAPDYIGYGESLLEQHPHTHKATLAAVGIDLLRASKSWMKEQNITDNGQLFLMGYSEGGYATYAMQKEIEENLSDEFTVTASVPAASAYSLPETASFYLSEPVVDSFLFQAFIIQTYNDIYNLDILEKIIRPEYIGVVENYFNGEYSSDQITAALPAEGSPASSFYQDQFLQEFPGGDAAVLMEKLEENSLNDWVPQAPTRFFQNPDDEIVPFQPVVDMVTSLQQQGGNVELVTCDLGGFPATHANCGAPAVLYTASFFLQYAQDL